MKSAKTFAGILALTAAAISCAAGSAELTKTELADKIKGGWAGQIIGCTYGGPTEFKYRQKIISDDVKIPWNENWPITTTIFGGLYDDLYLDVTFMDVFERFGFDAPLVAFHRAVGESSGRRTGRRASRGSTASRGGSRPRGKSTRRTTT